MPPPAPLLDRPKGTPVEIMEINLGGGIDSPSGLLRIAKLAQIPASAENQILHAHDLWSNIVGMPAAMLCGTPVTITSQRDLPTMLGTALIAAASSDSFSADLRWY
jgi:hypothetical protein